MPTRIRFCLRAGNGTRTRDPNLGKVVLYQLSYSRRHVRSNTRSHGGEGNRTPDLLNAIQALSQLSYTPGIVPDGGVHTRQEPRRISKGSIEVKKFALAKSSTASILQRFFNLNFSITQERVRFRVFRLKKQLSLARIAGPSHACIRIRFST